MYFCPIQHISSGILINSRSKYNVRVSDVIVLRSMRSGDSGVWGESSVESHPVEVEAEEQNGWGGCWKEVMNTERKSFYLLSPHSDSKQGSVCLEINSIDVWEQGSFTPVQVQPSVFPLGSRIPWRHQRERRHTAYRAAQTWRNPTKMSRDVRVGQVRASL